MKYLGFHISVTPLGKGFKGDWNYAKNVTMYDNFDVTISSTPGVGGALKGKLDWPELYSLLIYLKLGAKAMAERNDWGYTEDGIWKAAEDTIKLPESKVLEHFEQEFLQPMLDEMDKDMASTQKSKG